MFIRREAAQYLTHAGIVDSVGCASAVELKVHGQIRLKQRWMPFKAHQWIDPHRGFRWDASVKMGVLPVVGFDRYGLGEGEMKWRIAGIFPIVHESGPDIARSALGRLATEAIWCPAALHPDSGVTWSIGESEWLRVSWMVDERDCEIEIRTAPSGQLLDVRANRWGNPDSTKWREIPFGGTATAEQTCEGITIPSQISAGWWFGTDRFHEEGEFIRVTIDDAKTCADVPWKMADRIA